MIRLNRSEYRIIPPSFHNEKRLNSGGQLGAIRCRNYNWFRPPNRGAVHRLQAAPHSSSSYTEGESAGCCVRLALETEDHPVR